MLRLSCLNRVLSGLKGLAVLGLCLAIFDGASAQKGRMLVEGTIQMDGQTVPTTALIRILRKDSSIAVTATPYALNSRRFGVRISTTDGFSENDKLMFRVVLSKKDSFLARTLGPGLVFRGTDPPETPPVYSINMFRNHPPIFRRQLPDTTINEGQGLRFRIIAIDLDADTIVFSPAETPLGSTLDPITGLFSWTPTFSDAGTHRVSIEASDGREMVPSYDATVHVRNVNRTPRFLHTVADTVIREHETLRFDVSAVDDDGDTLTYKLVELQTGMEMRSPTGIFEWTPSYEDAGSYRFQAIADDGSGGQKSIPVNVTVLNVNRPPMFGYVPKDTSILENQELVLDYHPADPDGETIGTSMISGPEGVTLSDSGVFRWRPTFLQAGSYTIVVASSDSTSSSEMFTKIRVLNLNRAPRPPKLVNPGAVDTVRLSDLSKPIEFSWNRGLDEDSDDTLHYAFHFVGNGFDTTITGLADTSIELGLKGKLQPGSIYAWTVSVTDGTIELESPDLFVIRTSGSSAATKESVVHAPKEFFLEHLAPNPFNPLTSIRYSLPERSLTTLKVYNMLGERLLTLVSGQREAGEYDTTFDASRLNSGVYMLKLEAHPLSGTAAKDFVSTKKMILVK